LRLEAEVLVARGKAGLARERSDEALAVARELGLRPEIGHCYMAVSRMAARSGDTAKTAEHRAAARRVFDELSMTFWSGRE
jgi:hypothetical protein